MDTNDDRSLIPLPDRSLATAGTGAQRILSAMVGNTLDCLSITIAVQQAVEWLERNKGCGWDCRKCNILLQRSFDSLGIGTRKPIVDALCTCDIEDFERHQRLLWLVALLNNSEFERFVMRLTSQAPFERALAWRIIGLSADNQGLWRFDLTRGRASLFKPRFHLHPLLAPLLLAATIRVGTEREDALKLLTYYQPIASNHPILQEALRERPDQNFEQ